IQIVRLVPKHPRLSAVVQYRGHVRPSRMASQSLNDLATKIIVNSVPSGDKNFVTSSRTDTTLDLSQKAEKVASTSLPKVFRYSRSSSCSLWDITNNRSGHAALRRVRVFSGSAASSTKTPQEFLALQAGISASEALANREAIIVAPAPSVMQQAKRTEQSVWLLKFEPLMRWNNPLTVGSPLR
ncbi:hypothetical protein BVRB_034220, partial [Beta vulgaris subsp. vulgaris]